MRYIKLILLCVILHSCASKVPFTSDLQSNYQFPEAKLKKIQFYTSGEIVLIQTKTDGDVTVSDGKLIVKSEKSFEKIIVKKNTPCILEQVVDNNKFLFSFEYGEGRVLLFGNNSTGYFSLMSKDWTNKTGLINYANKKYLTTNGDVFLNVKLRKLKQLKGRERTVRGRKI